MPLCPFAYARLYSCKSFGSDRRFLDTDMASLAMTPYSSYRQMAAIPLPCANRDLIASAGIQAGGGPRDGASAGGLRAAAVLQIIRDSPARTPEHSCGLIPCGWQRSKPQFLQRVIFQHITIPDVLAEHGEAAMAGLGRDGAFFGAFFGDRGTEADARAVPAERRHVGTSEPSIE